MSNWKTVLGLGKLPLDYEIKKNNVMKAYKRKVLTNHPNKPGGSTEKFLQLKQAMEDGLYFTEHRLNREEHEAFLAKMRDDGQSMRDQRMKWNSAALKRAEESLQRKKNGNAAKQVNVGACKRRTGKPYDTRPQPPFDALECYRVDLPLGRGIRIGNDGQRWVSSMKNTYVMSRADMPKTWAKLTEGVDYFRHPPTGTGFRRPTYSWMRKDGRGSPEKQKRSMEMMLGRMRNATASYQISAAKRRRNEKLE